MSDRTFTAVFQEVEGGWWVAWAEELPGANTQGETLEEARENLVDAIQLMLEANREAAARKQPSHQVIREELTVAV